MNSKRILLLTLVHPDFLPPVYAVAQVLRDLGYTIHILTFDSLVPTEINLGDNIALESIGRHYSSGTLERLQLRNKFTKRARGLVHENAFAIIAFCPFSFNCGLKIKNTAPLLYFALEIADFIPRLFFKSPLSNYRNLRALQKIKRADLMATPSLQRSAWVAGRCHLNSMPYTILNTSYLPARMPENTLEVFKELVPANFLDKKIILYTGAINTDTCIMELIEAFDLLNDEQSVLIVNGMRDNQYCKEITEYVAHCKSNKRIQLLPYLTRPKVLALQYNAHVGVNLTKEHQDNVKSSMPAPNKLGEYLVKNLYIIGIINEYLRPFKSMGIASLAETSSPADISQALKDALVKVNNPDYKNKISDFVKEYFCMQQQLKPVIKFLDNIKNEH